MTKDKFLSPKKRQISDRKTGKSHIQPSNIYHLEEQQDRDDKYVRDVTEYDYNVRVTPRSTEQLNGTPIRYNPASNRNDCIVLTAGS